MATSNEQARVQLIVDAEEAGNQLDILRIKAAALTNQIAEFQKEGKLEELKKAQSELKATEKEFKQLSGQCIDVDRVMKNLSGSTLKDLERAQSKLRTETRGLGQDTQEFIDKAKQLRTVSAEVSKVKAEMSGVGTTAAGGEGKVAGFFQPGQANAG
jgi:myosin heavy subunit